MLTRLTKAVGVKGIYLSLCKKAKCVPWSVDVPIFGRVATLHEILNIHDNFAAGELRDDYIESFLRNSVHPVIVYCGVNTGVTIRWWLHINHNAMIYGIDMMQEAHDLTISRLGGGRGIPELYWHHSSTY